MKYKEMRKIFTEEDSLKQILQTFKREDLKIVNSEIYNNKIKMNSSNFQFIKKLWNANCAKCKNVKECGTYYSYGEKEIKNLNCDLKKGTTHFNKVIVEKYGFC